MSLDMARTIVVVAGMIILAVAQGDQELVFENIEQKQLSTAQNLQIVDRKVQTVANEAPTDKQLGFGEAVPTNQTATFIFSSIESAVIPKEKRAAIKTWFRRRKNQTAFCDNYVVLPSKTPHIQDNATDSVTEQPLRLLEPKVHPDYLKLVAGQEFYLESAKIKGAYLCTEKGPVSSDDSKNMLFFNTSAMLATPEEISDKDEWKYQLLPVPGKEGQVFYLRSKLRQNVSVPPFDRKNWDFLRIQAAIPTNMLNSSNVTHQLYVLLIRGKNKFLTLDPDNIMRTAYALNKPGFDLDFDATKCQGWIVHFGFPQVSEASQRFAQIAHVSETDKKFIAYTRWFKEMNHTSQWKDSSRLICRIMELRKNGSSVASNATKFLEDNLHPDYLRLLDGEPFNLENVKHKGSFLHMGRAVSVEPEYSRRDPDIYWDSTVSSASEFELISQDKWKYELIPVPGKDGQLFYLRSRLKAHKYKPIPKIRPKMESWNNNFVMIRPISSILRTADGTQDLRILFCETTNLVSEACEDVAWGPTQNDDDMHKVSRLPGMELNPSQNVSTDEGTQWTLRFAPIKGPGSAQNFHAVEQLESPGERLEEYKQWFKEMNHTRNWRDSVRLVHKIMELYNSSESSVSTDAKNFLNENLHPDFLRILAGEAFRIENVKFRGYYVHANVSGDYDEDIINRESVLKSSDREATFTEDNWNYQLLPVLNQGELIFYIRSRLQKNKPVPKFRYMNWDFVHLHPVSPITRNGTSEVKELQISFCLPFTLFRVTTCEKVAYGPTGITRPMNLYPLVEVGLSTRWIPRFIN